jgi:hypothetical protein
MILSALAQALMQIGLPTQCAMNSTYMYRKAANFVAEVRLTGGPAMNASSAVLNHRC